MTQGIVVTLPDLIALQSLVRVRTSALNSRKTAIGKNSAKARGRGMEIADIRHYQAGDEIRHMEWRITARTGRPHIKLYEEERERPVMILTDFSHSMYFGTRGAFKSFIAAQLAGLLAWSTIKQGDKIGGLMFSANSRHDFVPNLRNKSITPFLAALSNYTRLYDTVRAHQEQTQDLTQALSHLNRMTKAGCLIIIISDFYGLNASCQQQLSELKARHDLLSFHVCDRIELTPPPPGFYPISDHQQTSWLDVRNAQTQKIYQKSCEQRLLTIKEQFNQLNTPVHQVTAATKLEQLIAQCFSRRTHV